LTTKADLDWGPALTDVEFVLEVEHEVPGMETRFRQIDYFKDKEDCDYFRCALKLCKHDLELVKFKFDAEAGTIISPSGRLLWPRKNPKKNPKT